MAKQSYYDGPICYVDGWHHTVVPHPDGVGNGDDGHVYEVPGERLVCEDTPDGSEFRYRLATDADVTSWHDRKHASYTTITMEGGAPGMTVSAEEMDAINAMLAERRGGK